MLRASRYFLVVEIVDRPAKIEAFLPELDAMVGDGPITVEDVPVIAWRGRQQAAAGDGRWVPLAAGRGGDQG